MMELSFINSIKYDSELLGNNYRNFRGLENHKNHENLCTTKFSTFMVKHFKRFKIGIFGLDTTADKILVDAMNNAIYIKTGI